MGLHDHKFLQDRIACDGELLVAGRIIPCRASKLSMGGAFVGGTILPLDTRVTLRLQGPMSSPIDAACVVRWFYGDGIGLQFDALPPHTSVAIGTLIATLSRLGATPPLGVRVGI